MQWLGNTNHNILALLPAINDTEKKDLWTGRHLEQSFVLTFPFAFDAAI